MGKYLLLLQKLIFILLTSHSLQIHANCLKNYKKYSNKKAKFFYKQYYNLNKLITKSPDKSKIFVHAQKDLTKLANNNYKKEEIAYIARKANDFELLCQNDHLFSYKEFIEKFEELKSIINSGATSSPSKKVKNKHNSNWSLEQKYNDYLFIIKDYNDGFPHSNDKKRVNILKKFLPLEIESQKIPEQVEENCLVCFGTFDDIDPSDEISATEEDEYVQRIKLSSCNHENICTTCMKSHIKSQIEEARFDRIKCPANGCEHLITGKDIAQLNLDPKIINRLIRLGLKQILSRISGWVPCQNKDCHYGLLESHLNPKQKNYICKLCKHKNINPKAKFMEETVETYPVAKDKNGLVGFSFGGMFFRTCPDCKKAVTKDYGMCNLINCPGCGYWWNWKTKELVKAKGQRGHDLLQNKARDKGTLWMPGELEYQRNLPESELKKLLENNGVEFKKNYVRGS